MTESKTKTAAPKTEAAAEVAQAQPQPEKITSHGATSLDPMLAAMTPAQLRAGAKRAEKSGDKATAGKLTAAAKLAEQQIEQKKSEKSQKTASRDAVITFIAAALKEAFGSGKLTPSDSPFKVRISDEPPFAINATGSRKEGAGDDRPSINAKDLTGAKVDAFLMPDGNPVPPATVNNKPQSVHPVAYLNAFAPDSVCYYDRACRAGHAETLKEDGKLTDAQKQDIADGRGLRHGDAASRAFAALAVLDTTHSVKLTDGSIVPVKTLVTGILAAPAA